MARRFNTKTHTNAPILQTHACTPNHRRVLTHAATHARYAYLEQKLAYPNTAVTMKKTLQRDTATQDIMRVLTKDGCFISNLMGMNWIMQL